MEIVNNKSKIYKMIFLLNFNFNGIQVNDNSLHAETFLNENIVFQIAIKVEQHSCRHGTKRANLEKNQNQRCIPCKYFVFL